MWPFSKKTPPPPDVSKNGITARYDPDCQWWVFTHDGMDFRLSGIPFNENAFAWAGEAAPVIRRLDDEIKARVMKCLDEFAPPSCHKQAMELLLIDLDEYRETKTLDLAFCGDDSWGDLGVNVIVKDGKITEAYAGD